MLVIYTVHGNKKKEVEIQTQNNKKGHSLLAQVNSLKFFSRVCNTTMQDKNVYSITKKSDNGTFI